MGSVPVRHAELTSNIQDTAYSSSSVSMDKSLTLFWYQLFGVSSLAKISYRNGSREETCGDFMEEKLDVVLVSPVNRVSGHHYLGKIVTSQGQRLILD